ncbi:RluA family pseudouridine synthase [Candidatus Peregrinibacteria bacterium]|nr:MAG: RluA family pseudouridine synthase [Candidatus Peregrinibacteria bacterium]
MQFETQVNAEHSGKRVDQFLSDATGQTRSAVQKQILAGRVKINGVSPHKTGVKLATGDTVQMPLAGLPRPKLKKSNLKLEILFEDEKMLVINKPAGIVVHPDSTGHHENTIANAIQAHLTGKFEGFRPGIVHRLDKDTSGALIIAKTPESLHHLSRLFQNRKVHKSYLALVKDCPKTTSGKISAPIQRDSHKRKQMAMHRQGKNAVTTFEVLENYGWCSLLKVNIETGRTHQIRLHLAGIGHPVLGDTTYGNKPVNARALKELELKRQFLHAKNLEIDGKTFDAPLSQDLNLALSHFGV